MGKKNEESISYVAELMDSVLQDTSVPRNIRKAVEDAKNKILSMPPIINSHDLGKITENTKEAFIECSGSDFQILQKTLNIIVTMFLTKTKK